MIEKKIANFLFSTRLMAVLFLVFALAMAVGTFLEDAYSTPFARIYVYNTIWFELIIVLLGLNFLGNIKKYNLLRREKWLTLIFHMAFLLIIIGAGITRYISYEGLMPIENGETTDVFYSQKTYLSTYIDGEVDGEMMRKKKDFEVLLAGGANNHKTIKTDFKGQNIEFEIVDFVEGAKKTVVEDDNGKPYLKFVEASSGQRQDHFLEEGQVSSINDQLIAFNNETDGAINIFMDEEEEFTIHSPFPADWTRMRDQKKGELIEDSIQPLMLGSLYNMGAFQFVVPEGIITGKYDVVEDESEESIKNAAKVIVKTNGEEKTVNLMGNDQEVSDFTDIELGDLDIHLRYGSKEHQLPFSITLHEFIAEKFPGTADNPTPSYSAYKSKVKVSDIEKDTIDIYMNHVLDHQGFRFFQASFLPGEQGTVLSVNHDRWGTLITYIGYFILYAGLILILFVKGSRFTELGAQLRRIKRRKEKKRKKMMNLILVLLMMSFGWNGYSQSNKEAIPGYNEDMPQDTTTQTDTRVPDAEGENQDYVERMLGGQLSSEDLIEVIKENAVPEKQAEEFGKVVIQDFEGRMKPINTYSSELLRKLSKKETFEGLNSDQVLISMSQNPLAWYNVPLITVNKHNDSLRSVLDMKEGQKLAKFTQFFTPRGEYKFAPYLEKAYQAKVKDKFQEDMVEADRQVNLLHNALEGNLLKIFPIPDHHDNKWLSYPEAVEQIVEFPKEDSLFVANAFPLYLQSLHEGQEKDDYTRANSVLDGIKKYQEKYGEQVMPSQKHIDIEVYYNEHDIFRTLFLYFLFVGLFLFTFVIIEIFYPKKWMPYVINFGKIATLFLFILLTVGLGARWYISGHAPWSDAYESMIFVAWATVLFGLIFGRKSDLTIASTAFVTSMILMIAHWNWMDPAIANLEPVLDSYWLMIHVSVIVASYGPFTLGAILGVVALLLMIFTNKSNVKKMKINIQELTIISEMTLIVGLTLLTIGNFLGGQWANESWGRYWSWDPKETWALISIMVYAFVVHMRLVPGLNNRFAYNWTAIISFGAILFTYFGVNFYLSGLHSYASGDQIISYKFIGIAIGIWLILGWAAHRKYKKFYKPGRKRKKISRDY